MPKKDSLEKRLYFLLSLTVATQELVSLAQKDGVVSSWELEPELQ